MENVILLSHGDGGLLTNELIKKHFIPHLRNEFLVSMDDSAEIPFDGKNLFLTTDSYVVDPLFFPGGDIGKLSVYGTVNDLAVCGAVPLFITASFILEEGFEIEVLERIIKSMAEACEISRVKIVAGDTKVVPKGMADKIYITTTGFGLQLEGTRLGKERIEVGDRVIVNGSLGNHGLCILLQRGDFSFKTEIQSDCAPLNLPIMEILKNFRKIRYMRDLTRGGLATNLNEIVEGMSLDVILYEEKIPVDERVRGICEILGLDPLYLANEGKFVIFVGEDEADELLHFMKNRIGFRDAEIIGSVSSGKGRVLMRTYIGGTRRLGMLTGNPLPRIC